ncbi:hypothetical protein MBLNU457_3593t2 [Dothideomycetes sp. NU457]
MTSITTQGANNTFDSVYARIKTFPVPLLPPGKSYDASMTDTISSLYVHPTLESLLHILNHDLPSAHFLVRKMQSAPAVEGMYIHGLLHRVEGDLNNTRAWYADVCDTDVFTNYWGPVPDDPNTDTAAGKVEFKDGKYYNENGGKAPPQPGARVFLNRLEELQRNGKGDREGLERQSQEEIDALVRYCVDKFGTEKVLDARGAFVKNSDEINSMSQDMVSGKGGFRKF